MFHLLTLNALTENKVLLKCKRLPCSFLLLISVVRQFQEYVEPDEANEDRRRSGIKDEDRVLLPLDENILSDNLGLPMVVVVTKVSQCILVVECASQDKVDMCLNIPFLFYSMFRLFIF